MVIDNRIEQVRSLLERIRSYNRLIVADSFESSTINDLKGNAKDICDQAKAQIDEVKSEIDQWS